VSDSDYWARRTGSAEPAQPTEAVVAPAPVAPAPVAVAPASSAVPPESSPAPSSPPPTLPEDTRNQLNEALAQRATRTSPPPSGGSNGGKGGDGSGSGTPWGGGGSSRRRTYSRSSVATFLVLFFKVFAVAVFVIGSGFIIYVAFKDYGNTLIVLPGQGITYGQPTFGDRMKFFIIGEIWVAFASAAIAWFAYVLQYMMEIADNTFR